MSKIAKWFNQVSQKLGSALQNQESAEGTPVEETPKVVEEPQSVGEQMAVGIVLYHYLAGRVPFPYNTRVSNHIAEYELAEAHQKAVPPSIETIRKEFFEKKYEGQVYKKDYPQWLEDMILKCLRKKPEDRFKNGKELYDCIMEHAFETAKVSEEVEQKLENLKTKNEALETEVASLREINRSLNSVVNEKQTALLRMEQLLRTANEPKDDSEKQVIEMELRTAKRLIATLQGEKAALQTNVDRLQQEVEALKKKNDRLTQDEDTYSQQTTRRR